MAYGLSTEYNNGVKSSVALIEQALNNPNNFSRYSKLALVNLQDNSQLIKFGVELPNKTGVQQENRIQALYRSVSEADRWLSENREIIASQADGVTHYRAIRASLVECLLHLPKIEEFVGNLATYVSGASQSRGIDAPPSLAPTPPH